MLEVENLNRGLKHFEYETAFALYAEIVAAGYPHDKAVAMVYRQGRMDAKREAKERRKKHYEDLRAEQSQPEATTTIEEGEVDHE